MTEIIIKDLLKIHPDAKTLLDIGAGIGSMVIAARQAGIESQGVECNPYAVAYCEEKFNIRLKSAFFNNDLYQEKFDIITCIHIMEHMESPRAFFQDAATCLNKNGILYISVPLNEFRRKWWRIFARDSFLASDEHKIHFSSKGLVALAKQCKAREVIALLKPEWEDWSGGFVFKF